MSEAIKEGISNREDATQNQPRRYRRVKRKRYDIVQAVLAGKSKPLGLPAAHGRKCHLLVGANDAIVRLDSLAHGTISLAAMPIGTVLIIVRNRYPAPKPLASLILQPSAGGKRCFKGRLCRQRSRCWKECGYGMPNRGSGKQSRRSWRTWESHQARMAENHGAYLRCASWRQNGWLTDFYMTVQQGEAAVTNARDALAELHRVQAITEAESSAPEHAAADLLELEAHLSERKSESSRLSYEIKNLGLGTLYLAFRNAECDLLAA